MKRAVAKTLRFARVRALQHNLAAVATSKANQQVAALEASMTKLVSLRDGMSPTPGVATGAALAASGEIAMRLDQARATVAVSAASARARAATIRQAQMRARMKQETADRLADRAVRAADELFERKLAARGLPRKRTQES